VTKLIVAFCNSAKALKKNEMCVAYGTYVRRRGTYRFSVGKPEGMRQIGRYSLRWEDNVTMDFKIHRMEGCGLK
jgi:hypothetical protein